MFIEKHLLEKNYSFLKVHINNDTLTCRGFCQPSEYSIRYEYRVNYTPGWAPKVYVISPQIKYSTEIHMYSDGRLCLYYPDDYSWTSSSHLFETIIPWTHEWFLFYELYTLTGDWKHPFVDHKHI